MKKIWIVVLFTAVLTTGCKNKTSTAESDKIASEQETKRNEVEMQLPAQQHVGLQTEAATLEQMNEFFRATGTVQPIDSRVGEVSTLARGRVAEVKVKVGDRVKAGQVLATFDNLDAVDLSAQEQSAKAELSKLQAQLVPAARQTERSRHLADIGAVAEKDYEFNKAEEQGIRANIQSQEAVVRGLQQRLQRFGASGPAGMTVLRAPFSGAVIKVQMSAGDVLEPGRAALQVADLSHVWVQAEVYEKDLGRIRLGQDASIRVETYPDTAFPGRVTYISDVLDPQTRTARVRCEVANADMRLKADMYASIELPTTFSKHALTVSSSALQEVEGKDVVFVRIAPTKFAIRRVEKGVTVKDRVEIVSGLKDGEQVVTQGAFHLKSIVAGGELGDED
ncbi:efflux RND transporter periplasmic adaptor subunit [Terriglobus albidus]|uniref:Efflux RND transporter periplasmic adaptor subunit n=1 Tax=Terriglobus albidus TaxID=1592106 RepID=A0A5B9EJA5_9BACT|nr:efflux RND transporter periplasmic adaptor subunit [Terriglobus albidus]QEE30481.1 efflux RND transporter periplasmic adaptor subunit [Terriglobus albidus]